MELKSHNGVWCVMVTKLQNRINRERLIDSIKNFIFFAKLERKDFDDLGDGIL